MESKYFFVSYAKEMADYQTLIDEIILEDLKWIDNSLTIVNCDPAYSSILCQIVNHKLSYLNKHELYYQVSLEMPPPTMSQVWPAESEEPELFDRYLGTWVNKNLKKGNKYLFLSSSSITGRNLNRVLHQVNTKLDREDYRFGVVYKEEQSLFKPDYYVQTYNKLKQGGLLFNWEDSLNPNWNY
jgi:hypothetical protein